MKNLNKSFSYILAVSGGSDSMAMLHMMIECVGASQLTVISINHNLRAEAQSECDMVASFCNRYGVACHIESVDVVGYCQVHKVSIEMGARLLRRMVLDSFRGDYICLAHNSDDSVESIVMNMARGSGTAGIAGIAERTGRYIRPVLHYTKHELTQHCIDNNVPYMQDATNNDTVFTRNYIRHEVLPRLDHINSSARQHILELAQVVSDDNNYIDSTIDYSVVEVSGNTATIPVDSLRAHPAVAYRLVRHAIVGLVGNSVDIAKSHYDSIVALSTKLGGKKVLLPFDIIAYNDYNKVSIVVGKQQVAVVEPMPFVVGKHNTPLGVVEVGAVPHNCHTSLQFDMHKIPPTAVLRGILPGDTFTKFGGGTKPLRRYLIDVKVPSRERSNLLVVADNNNVLIICDIEISNHVRVDDNSSVQYITHYRGQYETHK